MVAQEGINVRETVGRKNNYKVNFFSMYIVRTKEEMHLSFKNSGQERSWKRKDVAINVKKKGSENHIMGGEYLYGYDS